MTSRAIAVVSAAVLLGGCVRAGYRDLAVASHDAAPDATCGSQLLTILTNDDDGEIDHDGALLPRGEPGSNWEPYTDPDAVYIGYWIDSKAQIEGPTRGYFRFRLTEAISPSAALTAADLTLHGLAAPEASADWDGTIHALRVRIEDAQDAPVVQSNTLPALLPQSVRWPAQGGLAWQANAENSVDVAPLLQSLVQKHGGLASGAHVQLWLWGDFTDVAAEVATPDVGRPGAVPARLDLRWCD